MPQPKSVSGILQSAWNSPEMAAELEKFRRNITVLFTDIKGSTAYFERFGDAAGLLMVHQCNEKLRVITEQHGGRVIKTIGDSVMAAFEDAPASITAAMEMQQAMQRDAAQKAEEQRVAIRIGINFGQGIVKSNDVFGDVVNVASRVESVAAPWQIVISETLRNELGASPVNVRYLGRFSLKGKGENHDLFEVVWSDALESRPAAAHTVVVEQKFARVPRFKLQHIRKDGTIGTEYEFRGDRLTVGRGAADLQFPTDPKMAPVHAAVTVEKGQMYVEDVAQSGVYFSLIGTYTLRDGDVINMGELYFEFRANAQEIEKAAAMGTRIVDLAHMLRAPVAEFVQVGAEENRYPITQEEVTWGRSKATYVFPDNPTMSRSHAKVYHRGEDFFLDDLGSRNATFVKVREKTPIPVGALLRVGGQLLKAATT